jgi:hypothetical protein
MQGHLLQLRLSALSGICLIMLTHAPKVNAVNKASAIGICLFNYLTMLSGMVEVDQSV